MGTWSSPSERKRFHPSLAGMGLKSAGTAGVKGNTHWSRPHDPGTCLLPLSNQSSRQACDARILIIDKLPAFISTHAPHGIARMADCKICLGRVLITLPNVTGVVRVCRISSGHCLHDPASSTLLYAQRWTETFVTIENDKRGGVHALSSSNQAEVL